MSWNKFGFGFLVVALLTSATFMLKQHGSGYQFSYFLIFLILQESKLGRAMLLIVLLSLGLDILFQGSHIKGLAAMSTLFLIFGIMKLKRFVVSAYHDLFLVCFFAFFYIAQYYMNRSMCHMFGVHTVSIGLPRLLILDVLHTGIFGLLLTVQAKLSRGKF